MKGKYDASTFIKQHNQVKANILMQLFCKSDVTPIFQKIIN